MCAILLFATSSVGLATAAAEDEEAANHSEQSAMAAARHALHHHAGGQKYGMVLVDRLEVQDGDEGDVALVDLSGWYGGDLNRLAFEVEAANVFDRGSDEDTAVGPHQSDWEHAELSLYWTRAISRYFDFKVGARYDFEPEPDRGFAAIGIQGLAPYWFEIDAELFVSEDGDVSARFEAEYEVLFTQHLVGQFRFEADASATEDLVRATGSGLNTAEAGFRVRYEIRREFAPYLGIEWERAFGATEDLLSLAGEETSSRALVAGLRMWF